jgi:hypothetical protein
MRQVIRGFDAFLANAVGVFEFTQDPACILRLQRTTLRYPLVLRDTEVAPGVPVLMLHLWNERVPPLPAEGPDLAWARRTSRSLLHSLHLVQAHMANQLPHAGLRAVGGITVLGLASGTADILAYLGFVPCPCSNPLGHFGEWWENAYAWSLMWAYNPASLRGKRLSRLRRAEYWMSAPAFLARFAHA